MMTICVFLGPSLPPGEARKILDATYLPPARRGDIHAAVQAHAPEAIALVDGYFEQVPSVWHKEILWALDRGVAVCGAASMGALRAAELAPFGMIGIGRVFEAYVQGRFAPFDDPFEDDDEVAVLHGPAELAYAASEAMVDMRATLAAAQDAGVLDHAQMCALAGAAKALFYKRRTWPAALARIADIGIPASVGERLAAWLPANRVAQKRLDAAELLEMLRAPLDRPVPAFRFERTVLWESAILGDAPADVP